MDMARNFDEAALDWDDKPRRVQLAKEIGEAMIAHLHLHPQLSVLDLGAGTGLVSLCIQPHVGTVTALDTSQGMLDVLAQKAKEAGIETIHTLHWDLEASPLPAASFDVVISAMALHHIENTDAVLTNLHACLKPGGQMAIADLDREDGSFHEDPSGVFHCGFDRGTLQKKVETAGFTNIRFVTASTVQKPKEGGEIKEYPVFTLFATQ
jgi:ubiquinone/menaquinone biosynthesis C-methylase UbiE